MNDRNQAAQALRDLVDRAFQSARWLVEGVSDDEFFWEPTPGCWSIRPRELAPVGWGTGSWICEDGWPPPDPVPVTTIGWRIVHLAAWTDIYRDWTWHDAALALADLEVPGTAAEALGWLHRSQGEFGEELDRLQDDDLLVERPAHYGGEVPVGSLVRGIAFEHIHHGAEIGVLRDLRRGHGRVQPYSED